MSGVCFEEVTYRYPETPDPVIRGLTLDLECGEISWIFGPAGAGASTLLALASGAALRHLGGIVSGRIRTLGCDPQDPAPLAGRVAQLLPSPTLQLSGVANTVWEEVAFTPANLGWPLSRIEAAVDRSLSRLSVDHLRDRHPGTLSGGETRRVMLAALAATSPDLCLLDEPASALDDAGRHRLIMLLQEEARRGAAVVVGSEDADLLAPVAHRLVFLSGGRMVADGRPEEVLRSTALRGGEAGNTSVALLAESIRVLRPDSLRNRGPLPVFAAEFLERWRA